MNRPSVRETYKHNLLPPPPTPNPPIQQYPPPDATRERAASLPAPRPLTQVFILRDFHRRPAKGRHAGPAVRVCSCMHAYICMWLTVDPPPTTVDCPYRPPPVSHHLTNPYPSNLSTATPATFPSRAPCPKGETPPRRLRRWRPRPRAGGSRGSGGCCWWYVLGCGGFVVVWMLWMLELWPVLIMNTHPAIHRQ